MPDGTSIAFAPLLPWAILAPLLAAAAIVVALGLWRGARGMAWRILALGVLSLTLLAPSLVSERREPVKDVAVIVVDDSPSQKLGDRAARAARALDDLRARLARFDDLVVRVVHSAASDAGAAINDTRLFEALGRAVADVPRQRRAGAVLITDGQVHDVPADARSAAGFGPVHTLLTGEHDEADRRLAIVQAPSFGIVGKPVTLTIRVDDLPRPQSSGALVTLRQDANELKRLPVPVGKEIRLDVTLGHGGPNVFELAVEPAAQELTLANNRVAIVVNGVRDRLRVLLVSGEPHPGERTWRNLLKADPSVDLVHFTILRPPEKQDGTPIRELSLIAFPIRELFEVKLQEFDLIIFDRYRRRGVLPQIYLENIARYVENGGALLESSGPTFNTPLSLFRTPLGAVLPGEPTGNQINRGFLPEVTTLGRRHPVTAGLAGDTPGDTPSWGRWFRLNDVEARRGAVVMTGAEGRPLLILDRVGHGRVAQLTSDQVWLWSRGFEGGGPQAELLRRLAHWLMKEPALEENDLVAGVDGNRITVERRSLKPDPHAVEMVTPSESVHTLALAEGADGRATASIAAAEPGIYRFSDGERTALAVVGAINVPELADMRTTPDRLAAVATATDGGMLWLVDAERHGGVELRRTRADRSQSGRDWIGLRANGDYVVTGITDTPLVPMPLVLLFTLAALFAAWRREGR
ncbi:MAG: hypothetical protein GC191_05050 [Azospirillum sp.]|nr:hypothetical protein [Azospirillum sp.]